MSKRHISIPVAMLTVGSLLLTACTSQVGGQANPSTTMPGSTQPTASTPSTNSADPFAGMSPCTTLDQSLASQGGFPPAKPAIVDENRTCSSSRPTIGTVEGVNVTLALQGGQKIDENITNPSKASSGTVNSRPAAEEREPLNSTGQCSIKIEVKPNSRASLLVTYSSDTEKACKLAEAIAEKVEPLLPKTN